MVWKKLNDSGLPVDIGGITIFEEGIKQNTDSTFKFDFEHDDSSDIISLTNPTIHQSSLQNIHFYYFAYKFNDLVPSTIRTKFIHHLKFDCMTSEKARFVKDAISKFGHTLSIQQFEYIIYPQSSSDLTKNIVSEIRKIALPEFSIGTIELTKAMPQNIGFDYDGYKLFLKNATNPNGTKKYGNDKMVQSTLDAAKEQMAKIHNLEYFSIAKNIKGKYKDFLTRFYQFKDDKDSSIYKALKNGKVLVVDDIMMSGTTLLQLFKALKTVNPSITPIVFTLLGKEQSI